MHIYFKKTERKGEIEREREQEIRKTWRRQGWGPLRRGSHEVSTLRAGWWRGPRSEVGGLVRSRAGG